MILYIYIYIYNTYKYYYTYGRKYLDESEKSDLKLNTQKAKIMASSPITSWKIHGEIMETATDFIFLGSKITVDGDCNHDIKRCLLLGRKVMKNLDSILKAETLLCQQTSIYSQRYGFSSSHVGI